MILIVLLFSTLELLCRYLLDSKEPARETGFEYTVDPDTLWHMVPTQTDAQPHVEFEYVINSHGLRCPDFPLKKPGGEKRILTIGDSVTMGHGVAEGEAYPQLLQKYLDERLPDVSLRVINGGVNAYSTREELMFLRKKGMTYEPDVVIVGFVLNDVWQLASRYYLNRFGKRITQSSRSNIRWIDILEPIHRSHLVRFVSPYIRTIILRIKSGKGAEARREQEYSHYKDLLYSEKEVIEEGWMVGVEELGKMATLLHDNGVEMVLVVFPVRLQLEEIPTPDRPQRRLKEFCENHGVLCVDLLPLFLANKDAGLFIDHVHLTPEGYTLAASEIGRCLIESGSLLSQLGS